MILTGNEIKKSVCSGKIVISPFSEEQLTSNSYDLRLGDILLKYKSKVLDPKKKSKYEYINIPSSGYTLNKGDFVLGSTKEKIGSNYFVPIIHAKSGIARMGLFVHITADLIDIGSIGNSTLQFFATLPVKIFPDMLIAQVSFWVPKGKITLYKGKYQHSEGPKSSLTYLDYHGKKH